MNRRWSAGFSLLEAQLAFVIVAIVLAVLYQSVQSSLRATARIDHQLQVVNLAQNLLTQFSAVPIEDVQVQGSVGTQPAFSWHLQSQPLAAEGTAARLALLRITINWTEAGRARAFILETAVPRLIDEDRQSKGSPSEVVAYLPDGWRHLPSLMNMSLACPA